MSGAARRDSMATHHRASTAPAAATPRVGPDVQPNRWPCVTRTSSAVSAPASATAAQPVDPRARAGRSLGHEARGGECRDRPDHAHPEDGGGAGAIDDDPGDRRAQRGTDPETHRQGPDRAHPCGGRERVADDPVGQGEHAAGDALKDAPGNQQGQGLPERAHDRAGAEDGHHPGQRAPAAEQVAEPPDERRGNRSGDEVRRQQPGHGQRAGAELAHQRGQRRQDQRLGQRVRHPAASSRAMTRAAPSLGCTADTELSSIHVR